MNKLYATFAAAALVATASPALAKGHAVAGAAAGCAIGHHHAAKKASAK